MSRPGATLLVVAALAGPAWGQAVPSREPSSTHIFPAGGRRGTVVKVRVGGECLPPGIVFKLYGTGVEAPPALGPAAPARGEPSAPRPPRDADGAGAAVTYPREFASEIKIANAAALGPRTWRVTGAWGGTAPRPFLVGDLPEFVETEPNSRPDRAERVTLPVVVNGQIAGERDQDFFVFAAKAGDVVACDVLAARIGSPLDPAVTITDAKGNPVKVQEARVGDDPVLAFRAPATGDYRLHVANLGAGGGPAYVYRITLSTARYAPFAFPPAGRAGEERAIDLYAMSGTGWSVVREKVKFPPTPGPFPHGHTPLVATAEPELVSTGKDTAETAMDLAVPAAAWGRFSEARSEGWFKFTAKKGQALTLSCRPFPADGPAVPTLAVLDPLGATLATVSGVDAPDRAAELDWTAPADGTYRVRLRDLQHGSRGGPDFIYRLTVGPARPDFELRLEPNFVNVVQGGKTEIDLVVRRAGGFAGPIDLEAAGLPAGVTVEPKVIPPGVPRLKLAFAAEATARPADTVVRLVGRAAIGSTKVEHPAAGELYLTIQHKPLFRLSCNEAYQYAHRGTVYPYALSVERLNGFDGPITLQLCDRQVQDLDGITVVETVIPPGVKETAARVLLSETMHPAAQHHSRPYVQGYATFTDAWGQRQTILAVCEKRCMIRTLPPVAKLRAEDRDVVARLGETVTCRLMLDRTANFPGPARVELVSPAGYMAEPVQLKEGETAATVRVRVPKSEPSGTTRELTFRAVGALPGGATLHTEATVPLELKSGPPR